MSQQKSKKTEKLDIDKLLGRSQKVLSQLITKNGIYASVNAGWKGPFHAWFGRDSAITAGLVFDAESITGSKHFSLTAYEALRQLGDWQGVKNRPEVGEERGKIPHEVRLAQDENIQTQERLKRYRKLWFMDPHDKLLKSWDSVDSTALWVIIMARHAEITKQPFQKKTIKKLRLALEWCLSNLSEFDGWAGFSGSELHAKRKAAGLHNQTWKDNFGAYQYPDGSLVEHPIKDVFVQGLFWAAFQYGAEIFDSKDRTFSVKLRQTAIDLKSRFNQKDGGFLFYDQSSKLFYFAEALDGHNQALTDVAADVAMCLWAYYENECIIDAGYIEDVVKRSMLPDMLNPEAGMRNYWNSSTAHLYSNGYHRGPNTYWPFVSAIIANGIDHFGFKKEAKKVALAMLHGVNHFDSCLELFVKNENNRYEPWHHPIEKQESAVNQAWTAAGMYYVANYLLKS
jgi:glycogen debranching enzyme